MELIIIGVYDDLTNARSAKNELLASGFVRGDVQLNPDRDLLEEEGPVVQKGKKTTISGSIENFARSLFSMGDKGTYSNVYAEAVRRGSYVLTVDVDSHERRLRAEEIMRHHGSVDIDERSADWVRHGWSGHDPQASEGAAKKAGSPPAADTVRAFPRRGKKDTPE
jgi:hypothetical protein